MNIQKISLPSNKMARIILFFGVAIVAFLISSSQKHEVASADVWVDGVNCSDHFIRFRISSHFTNANGSRINGVRVDFGPSNAKGYIVRDCPAVWFDRAPYWFATTGFTGNDSRNYKKAVGDGDGFVEFDANCMNTLPFIEFVTPSDKVFVRAEAYHNRDNITVNSVGAFNSNFANGSKGWMYKTVWKAGINGSSAIYIDLIFRDKNIWDLNGTSTLSNPTTGNVTITTASKNVTFKHVISNATICGGVPCNTASFKYRLQKCISSTSTCTNYVDIGSEVSVSSLARGTSISPVYDSSITIPSNTANGAVYCQRINFYDSDGPDGPQVSSQSTPVCYKATKAGAPTVTTTFQSPYFQLRNGGIMAGCNNGVLAGFYNNSGGSRLGSSTTLASISNGDIVGFASMLNTLRPNAGSFANTDSTKNTTDINSPLLGGNFGLSNCYLSPSFSLPTSSSYSDSAAFNGSSNSYTGNTTIAATTQQIVPQSKKVVININGDAYIKNNITYSSWTTIDQMPSLVIKATGNIYIDPSVTQIDGTFISDKSIYTCSTGFAVGGGLSASSIHSTCKNQLVVYGAFIAKKINLLRTFGDINNTDAGPCSNPLLGVKIVSNSCAAEVFILSPEIYLNGTNLNSVGNNRSVLPYDMIKSLPPTL